MFSDYFDGPFRIHFSFQWLVERWEDIATSENESHARRAKDLIHRVRQYPQLIEGITDEKQLKAHEDIIADLLSDLFPKALTLNEIKAVTLPFQNILINKSQRFSNIITGAGKSLEFTIRDFDSHQFYVLNCCLILREFYGINLDFSKPLFYDIPTRSGVVKHYRILYNADFLRPVPTPYSRSISHVDIDLLVDNYDNLDIWKQLFPPGSWDLKGFALVSLVDVTVENALSTLKSDMSGPLHLPDVYDSLTSVFRSTFDINDLRIGFTFYDSNENKFYRNQMAPGIRSFLLPETSSAQCTELLNDQLYDEIILKRQNISVSNIDRLLRSFPDDRLGKTLVAQDAQSFILAPIVKDGKVLGILELVSPNVGDLNSVSAHKLDFMMPFLTDTMDRRIHEMEDRLQALIQNNYTSLHPSVYWKFKAEADLYYQNYYENRPYALSEVLFQDVYPLFGQVDIMESTLIRNRSVRTDLVHQLKSVSELIQTNLSYLGNLHPEEIARWVSSLEGAFSTELEHSIQEFLTNTIHPLLHDAEGLDTQQKEAIANYFLHTDPQHGSFHSSRRAYDFTVSSVNNTMVSILDGRQAEIQAYFPHYYERFKTDGVEHNLYIGNSISRRGGFALRDLRRLRLWELLVTVEIEIEHDRLRGSLPYSVGVRSLILAIGSPIDIRFRTDEKHFDIDGSYSVRYEVIKKRIDKAHIKGTGERITQPGNIVVIYSGEEDAKEYLHYFSILQQKQVLAAGVEYLDVEELNGVLGLKALRVGLVYDHSSDLNLFSTYDDFYDHL